MSNLYMDKEYVIAGYIIGDETTNVFQAVITYDTVEASDSITYTFNVLDQTTAKEASLLYDTELRLSNGKTFVIPMGRSTYSVSIPKASLIDLKRSKSKIIKEICSLALSAISISSTTLFSKNFLL